MMRAMMFFTAIAFVGIWVYLGIHHGKEFGEGIKNTLKKLFH